MTLYAPMKERNTCSLEGVGTADRVAIVCGFARRMSMDQTHPKY